MGVTSKQTERPPVLLQADKTTEHRIGGSLWAMVPVILGLN